MNDELVEYFETEAPLAEKRVYELLMIEQKYKDAMDQIARAHDLLDDAGVPAFDEDIGNRVAYAAGMVAAIKEKVAQNGQEPASETFECEACDHLADFTGSDHARDCPRFVPQQIEIEEEDEDGVCEFCHAGMDSYHLDHREDCPKFIPLEQAVDNPD